MAAVTIVQHKGTDPNAGLAQILNDPTLGEADNQSFRIRCASRDALEAIFKGDHFVFDKLGLPKRGKIDGIVLYEDSAIAAQYVNLNFPAKKLSALILSRRTLNNHQVLGALGVSEADVIFIR